MKIGFYKEKDEGDVLISIGRTERSKKVLVGDGQDLRIVAPFGFSGQDDLKTDLFDYTSLSIKAGADIIQELSTYGPFIQMRPELIRASSVPYGTVLAYEVVSECLSDNKITPQRVEYHTLKVVDRQIGQGVDYFTVHASLSKDLLAKTEEGRSKRAIPLPSRAAGMLITLMQSTKCDNPLRTFFEKIVKYCSEAGVVISLGSSLRSAAISDAMDQVQIAELEEQGILAQITYDDGVQTMLEGLSHAVPDDLEAYCNLARKYCPKSPVTALGPLPVDISAGFDHVAAAIGVTFGSLAGLALVNVVTSKEHLAMPSVDDMVDAIRATKLGAYVAKVIRQGKISDRDRKMSEARAKLNWSVQNRFALFEDLFHSILVKTDLHDEKSCTICGRRCPFFITNAKIS